MKLKFNGFLVLFLVLVAQLTFAQERAVSGTVSDNAGIPLPGVSVLVKGTKTATQTDFDGKYSIKAAPNQVLVFSYIGMKAQEVSASATTVNAKLKDDSVELESVVVTALGVKKSARALGYATQEVKAADITRANNNSLSGALQGKLAGVQITPSSGAPGASSQIVIRGARSFTGNNTPLYVIDGMPVTSQADFSTGNGVSGADVANRAVDIDPNEIESINVLKGQAASALYGLRASNGVILITTKSGKNLAQSGKPTITFNTSTSFETISKKPSTQNEYAQGTNGVFDPNSSMNWGPKISELPNDLKYGGNVSNALNGGVLRPGKYYVPQRAKAGLDPWVAPQAYDNINDFFNTGVTINNSLNIAQSTEKTNYSFGVGTSKQDGIIPETGMNRYTAKAVVDTKLSNEWKTGFSFNYVQTKINKSTSANDGAIAGVFSAPRSYDLKGNGYASPTNPYDQIYFRPTNFNNPYWAAKNNEFSEKTNRVYGNAYIQYSPVISEDGSQKLTVKYQAGVDSWTTNYRDIFEFGNKLDLSGKSSSVELTGTTQDVINSLFTLNYNLNITDDFNFNILVGNEYNHRNNKIYEDTGINLNFGGWPTIANARTVSSIETRRQVRTLGFFSNAEFSYKNMIFLSGTIRKDIASNMPRNNRDFVYPSASLGFVLTELEGLKGGSVLSYAKLRGSIAEVGQSGDYIGNSYTTPSYSGGFWSVNPIQYPLDGVSSFIPNTTLYDPNLKPQNTKSYEVGADVKLFNNRIGLDYTYSEQNSTNQIFNVPLAGSSGASSLVTNGGKMLTTVHELSLMVNPVRTADFNWTFNVNYSQIDSKVLALKDGVDNIFLGGFTTPQLRASVGDRFPVIFGDGFARDANNNIIVDSKGLPTRDGKPKVLGEVAPKFTLGGSTQFTYKRVSLGAVVDWKNGGKMYSGSNSLMNFYGVDARTADRDSQYIYPGVKADGTPNDIAIGGAADPNGHQALQRRLSDIAESAVFDASFVKLREVTLGYQFPKLLDNTVDLRASVFARNILLWSKMPNLDPEATQGNNNFSGGFEQFTMPQTKSIGFGLNFTF
ncbi:SusC/RagA family TonB-linked outer membrane protein [Flavobacterium collinsii]|uniref:SusC/RagA family TonB-dependent outer membrane receptor n=1 Tax=Flavobacterium collinsii TaxID=1114861 RepID=A0A9W4X227_9FLAO|nr:SusC/RagA family TonB-linked outer membrane protein [Flavobacterium collinsii]CAA9200570.1 TonB-dependent receptor P26 [Flavobacterium collinsii]CAI2765478.1 SusC/RagA family TonB-dependent outer membrane receptor precursor [Flavobacterium collinsii]